MAETLGMCNKKFRSLIKEELNLRPALTFLSGQQFCDFVEAACLSTKKGMSGSICANQN